MVVSDFRYNKLQQSNLDFAGKSHHWIKIFSKPHLILGVCDSSFVFASLVPVTEVWPAYLLWISVFHEDKKSTYIES